MFIFSVYLSLPHSSPLSFSCLAFLTFANFYLQKIYLHILPPPAATAAAAAAAAAATAASQSITVGVNARLKKFEVQSPTKSIQFLILSPHC